jgi:hypothetical protein
MAQYEYHKISMELAAPCSYDHVDAICELEMNGLWSDPRHQHGMYPEIREKTHVKSHFLQTLIT